tara:strand:+ start:17700 stop:18239 length:540 start_codon:yes stop_codon:yes gene_type:complete
MSTLDAISNVQQQLSKITSSSTTSGAGGEAFSKALDFAMDSKSLVLPTPVNAAVDLGLQAFDINGLISSESSSIQEGIEDVFSDLSVGIATSFVAALSGADSATAIIDDTITETTTDATSLEETADSSLLSAKNASTVKNVLDSVAPLLTDNKAVPLASTLLSTLEGVLLDDEEEDKKS